MPKIEQREDKNMFTGTLINIINSVYRLSKILTTDDEIIYSLEQEDLQFVESIKKDNFYRDNKNLMEDFINKYETHAKDLCESCIKAAVHDKGNAVRGIMHMIQFLNLNGTNLLVKLKEAFITCTKKQDIKDIYGAIKIDYENNEQMIKEVLRSLLKESYETFNNQVDAIREELKNDYEKRCKDYEQATNNGGYGIITPNQFFYETKFMELQQQLSICILKLNEVSMDFYNEDESLDILSNIRE